MVVGRGVVFLGRDVVSSLLQGGVSLFPVRLVLLRRRLWLRIGRTSIHQQLLSQSTRWSSTSSRCVYEYSICMRGVLCFAAQRSSAASIRPRAFFLQACPSGCDGGFDGVPERRTITVGRPIYHPSSLDSCVERLPVAEREYKVPSAVAAMPTQWCARHALGRSAAQVGVRGGQCA